MDYVLSYTVIPEHGAPGVVEGVSHEDALMKFVSNPRIRRGRQNGTYEPADGETIRVSGVTQAEFQERWFGEQRLQRARETQPRRGRNGITREQVDNLITKAHDAMPPEAPVRVMTFTIRYETVYEYDKVEEEAAV